MSQKTTNAIWSNLVSNKQKQVTNKAEMGLTSMKLVILRQESTNKWLYLLTVPSFIPMVYWHLKHDNMNSDTMIQVSFSNTDLVLGNITDYIQHEPQVWLKKFTNSIWKVDV